uniref:MULE transposase domain-containing protein n=1 Tax=Nelumbo nucifera TaxID=4432 RepID=A0A822Z457_NELNU|nr:TPA_asm: hypothetical protein HUJ06_008916 [Nelumbo nucifera]
MVQVHKYQPLHSHTTSVSSSVSLPISNKFVGNLLVEKVRDNPSYRAMNIAKDIKCDYALQLTYQRDWRGKEVAKVLINSSDDDSYSRIPWFYKKIVESNPCSYVTYSIDEDDEVHSNGKYQGKFLAATTIDANNGMFLVSFVVVPAECLKDCTWFMGHFKEAISDDRDVVIVSDRGNSLMDVVQRIFRPNLHAFYCRHLMENLKSYDTASFIEEDV